MRHTLLIISILFSFQSFAQDYNPTIEAVTLITTTRAWDNNGAQVKFYNYSRLHSGDPIDSSGVSFQYLPSDSAVEISLEPQDLVGAQSITIQDNQGTTLISNPYCSMAYGCRISLDAFPTNPPYFFETRNSGAAQRLAFQLIEGKLQVIVGYGSYQRSFELNIVNMSPTRRYFLF